MYKMDNTYQSEEARHNQTEICNNVQEQPNE